MRYFTDFTDDRGLSRDEEGLPFADCHAACLSATEALVEAAQDRLRVRARKTVLPVASRTRVSSTKPASPTSRSAPSRPRRISGRGA